MSEHVNLLDVLTEGRELPEGCDTWGVRTVRPDGASSHGFVWPLTPKWVEAPGPIHYDNPGPCPRDVGDGISLAYSWRGMSLGGVPARTLLLCAYGVGDILGSNSEIARFKRVYVAAVIDGERLIREHGHGANLRRANLSGMDLRGADLRNAILNSAALYGANLSDVDLRGADMHGAHLGGADLRGADMGDWERDPETGLARRKAVAVEPAQ